MSKFPGPQQPEAAQPAAQEAQAVVASSLGETLNTREADRTVVGTVLEVEREFIWIETEGTRAKLYASELMLGIGEVPADHYAPGDHFAAFVFQMQPDADAPQFSIRRAAPYPDALNRLEVGSIVANATVVNTYDAGIELDVDGVRGNAFAWEFPLARGESTHQRYQPGDITSDLLVYEIDDDERGLFLSARRNAPGYVEALNAYNVGDVVSGTATGFWSNGGLWLDVGGVIGSVSPDELSLADGESAQDRYAVGDTITARVWQIDQEARDVILSVHRLGTDSIEEPIALGATIDSVVREVRHGAIRVLVASQSIRILMCELSLGIGDQPHFKNGDSIPVVVLALDSDGKPSALSHRRALPEWQAAVDRLAPDVVVPDALVVPKSAVPENEDQAVVDLGPVNGFVRRDELDAKQAEELMVDAPNTQYPVVVESIEATGANVTVSGVQFEERWGELSGNFPEGDPVDAEFRQVSRDRAIVDLGFGLLAEMPREQLPTISEADTQRPARKGDIFPVRITHKLEGDYLIMAENKNQWLADMIAADENLVCEFKAVYRGTDRRNKLMRSGLPVLRAMVGMMNRSGGYVLIGVQDTAKEEDDALAQVIGWQASGFKMQNSLTTDLGRLVSETLPPAAASLYEARFEDLLDGTEILVIKCEPTDSPVYLKPPSRFKPKGNGEYEFPLRYDAVTRHNWPPDEENEMRNLREYFPQRWPDRDPQAMWDEFEEKILGRSLED